MNEINTDMLDENSRRKLIQNIFLTTVILFLSIITYGMFLLLLLAVLPVYFLLFPKLKKEQKYRNFARKNNMKFVSRLTKDILPPFVQMNADKRTAQFLIKGSREYDFKLFPFTYSLAIEQLESVTLTHWTMLVKLNKELPTFIVNAKLNDLEIKNNLFKKIIVEGDFSDYFDILAAPSSHIDCLSVLSPEVLYKFRDFWASTDMIVQNRSVWFIGTGQTDKADIQELFDVADTIVPELQHRARTYRRVK